MKYDNIYCMDCTHTVITVETTQLCNINVILISVIVGIAVGVHQLNTTLDVN